MSKRRSFIIVGTAIGCLVLLFCLGVVALAGITFLNNNVSFSQSVDRIAYVDNDLNIQVVDARGENRVALTTDASPSSPRVYIFPTWSPDSQHVAFVGIGGPRDQREATLYSAPAIGGNLSTVFKSTLQFPFYLYWSPDSQRIGFLAQADNGLSLLLGRADGQENARTLDTGSPLYWAWSPDGQTMLLHVGGSKRESRQARLELLRWQERDVPQKLTQGPAAFQAPQYSPDGSSMLYAVTGDSDQDALYFADAQGANPQSIVTYQGRIAFAWSPDGKKIASLVTPEDSDLPHLGQIHVSDGDGKNRKPLTNDDALGFYWSPDSKRIAYLTLPPLGQRQGCENDCGWPPGLAAPMPQGRSLLLQWRIVEMADGQTHTLANFTPTDNFLFLLPYFDQYARSLTFWSPDSQHFVYTQREGEDAGSVWVVDVIGETNPRRIGDGTLAVWSWK